MPGSRTFSLLLVPTLVTLGVTIARLVGERAGGGPPWFSSAPGGDRAVVGIIWLVPVFGAWFGLRLARAGARPALPGRSALLHLLAVAVYVGGFLAASRLDTATGRGLVQQLLAMGGVAVMSAAIALLAWPRLFVVDLLYAILARVPVVAITLLAVSRGWGTHYEKFGPKDFALPPLPAACWLAYTQLVCWTGFTAAVGGLFGTLAAVCVRPLAATPAAAPAPTPAKSTNPAKGKSKAKAKGG
jgi:hypothetical protein